MKNYWRHRGTVCAAAGWALILQGSRPGATGSCIHLSRIVGGWGGGWSSWQRTADENTMLMKTHQLIFFQILIFIKTTVTSQTLPLWQGKIMTITTWRELFTKDLGDRIHAGFQLLPRDVSFGLLSLIADIWTEWTARQWCFTQKWECIQRGCQTPLCGYFYSVYTLFLWVT